MPNRTPNTNNTNMFPTPKATQSALIVAMRDLLKYSKDTIYISEHETVFERLTQLYFHAGGKHKQLEKIFPEYF